MTSRTYIKEGIVVARVEPLYYGDECLYVAHADKLYVIYSNSVDVYTDYADLFYDLDSISFGCVRIIG